MRNALSRATATAAAGRGGSENDSAPSRPSPSATQTTVRLAPSSVNCAASPMNSRLPMRIGLPATTPLTPNPT